MPSGSSGNVSSGSEAAASPSNGDLVDRKQRWDASSSLELSML